MGDANTVEHCRHPDELDFEHALPQPPRLVPAPDQHGSRGDRYQREQPQHQPFAGTSAGRDVSSLANACSGGEVAADSRVEARIVRAGLSVGFTLLVAQTAAHLVTTLGFRTCHTDFGSCDTPFDLWQNNGILDLVSLVLIVLAALGACVLAMWDRRSRISAAVLAAMFALIAIDDSLQQDDLASMYGLVVVATLLAAGVLVIEVARKAPPAARILLVAGLVLLALDVKEPYAYDQLMNLTGNPALARGDVLYEVGIVLDEGMELMAWTLLATGLWAAAAAAREGASRSERQAAASSSPLTTPRS